MKKKFPIWPVIIGTALVVFGALGVAFGLAFLAKALLEASMKDAVASMILTIPSAGVFLIYFFLFEGILFTTQAKTFKELLDENNPYERSEKKDRRFKIITRSVYAVIIALCLIFPAIYMNCYTKIEDNEITERTVFIKSEYTLDDISTYRVGFNDTGLVFYINMYNGDSFEILQSDGIYSKKFSETFENKYAYASYLADVFDSNEKIITRTVTNPEKIKEAYKDIPEAWEHISKFIE